MRSRRTSPVAAVVAALALLVGLFVIVPAIIPGLDDLNPFKETTEDRSPPVVVRSLESLSEYRAATSNMQVVVDVEQDARFLPDFIKGERTLIVASGSVDASVDFRALAEGDLRVDDDRRAVTVTLPRAKLSAARVDLDRTRVFDRDRGVLDRVGEALGDGGADRERQLLQLAQRRLKEAAVADGRLAAAAERNTRSMLSGMLRGLGFERVTIRFEPRPQPED
jgi:hypothetical protein